MLTPLKFFREKYHRKLIILSVSFKLTFSVKAIESLESVSKATDIAGRSFVLTNFLINLAFSCSLNLLWSLVNALQILVHMPLVNIALPINSYIVSKSLANVASFDIVPTQLLYYKIFSFE